MFEKKLSELWKRWQGQMASEKLNEILARGICYAKVSEPHRILVTGINPSWRKDDPAAGDPVCAYSYQDIIAGGEDRYFLSIDKLFPENFKREVAYLDILNYRETEQNVLYDFYKSEQGISFVAENLRLNQLWIEQVVRPRLIMVKNKASWDLWGKNATATENIWMGYSMELVETLPCGDVCRITGLVEHPDRVAADCLFDTNLKGTVVLFTSHFQYCSAEKRPTPELMARLCAMI